MSSAGGGHPAEPGLPSHVNVLIVGGGIQGLSVAYNLARLGERNLLVLDAGYFQGGASGRNGTLIRGGFASDAWTALFALTNRRWIELSGTLRRNVMFSRRGYLMVAEKPATAERFDAALSTHRSHGVKSRRVTRRELASIAPALAADRVLDAIYLPEGGVAPHHAAMDGYLGACREAAVEIRYSTPVSRFLVAGSRVEGVVAGRPESEREIRADHIVIAAGAQSVTVGRMAGIELAGFAMRIEAMALEPARNLLRPAVALIDRLCYLGQTARGEIVGGAEVPERPKVSLACDLPVMATTARAYRDMFPCFGQLRILRHWAGMIHATPDFGPLIGIHPSLENLWITAGWSYGFAGAPATGELLARAIHTGALDPRLAPFAVDRFERNAPVRETGIVLAPSS